VNRPRVVVCGLGPATSDLVTAATLAAIDRVPRRYLRTRRHPSAGIVGLAESFDRLYETSATFDQVYDGVVAQLVAKATEHGEVLYAVPGSPRVAERSVDLLCGDDRVEVVVHPALSFLDLAWVRLGVDPLLAGVRVVDGHGFTPGQGPLLVAQCDSRAVLSDVKLAVEDGPEVTVLHHLGLPDERVFSVDWHDLDRSFEPDHLTSLWVPGLEDPVRAFAGLVRTLRERCPWDAEQTHRTLTRHLLEETYEVLEAIEEGDDDHLREELGDLLFQVVFHATIGEEREVFTLSDIAQGIHDKLVTRHPHVFAGVEVDGPDDVIRNWEQIKKAEKGRSSVMEGIPGDLPALLYAHKVLRKASSVGVEVSPATLEDDLGLQLLRLVDAARRAELDPEAALRAAAARVRDDAVERERTG
jgi:tetrapyrrole methylase family protein/MazG family protein